MIELILFLVGYVAGMLTGWTNTKKGVVAFWGWLTKKPEPKKEPAAK